MLADHGFECLSKTKLKVYGHLLNKQGSNSHETRMKLGQKREKIPVYFLFYLVMIFV